MENVYDCYSASRSSSWKRSFREFTFNPKSATTNSETIVRCDKEGQGSESIQGISVIDWYQSSWKRTTLLTDPAVRSSTAKTHIFSDSVLCMGRISENPVSACKEKIDWFVNSSQCRELDRIDEEAMELAWKKFPRFTTLQTLAEIQNMMTELQCEPEQSPGRIIFMSVYNDSVWGEKGNKEMCTANSQNRSRICKKIRARTSVVSWAWIRKEMVRNSREQTEWRMGSCR